MQETKKYIDLEDQEAVQPKEIGKHTELQTTTSEEVRLQNWDTNEIKTIISIFIKQEEEASKALA